MVDEQMVDWVESVPGEELKRMVNDSIRRHNQRGFELEHIKEIEHGSRNEVRLLLLYEKD